jgi:hypothetical protein
LKRLTIGFIRQEARECFRKGDPLTDEQLKLLIATYQIADGVLSALGVEYEAVHRSVRIDLSTLESFEYHRSLRK